MWSTQPSKCLGYLQFNLEFRVAKPFIPQTVVGENTPKSGSQLPQLDLIDKLQINQIQLKLFEQNSEPKLKNFVQSLQEMSLQKWVKIDEIMESAKQYGILVKKKLLER